MRILTIGGTRFSGRALTGLALERGHDVTVFHRGTGEDPWPEAEHVHGDRADGFASLAGRSFDAVVDLCGYLPRELGASTSAFAGAGRYVFVSSLSAHRDDVRPGATEDDDIHEPPFPDTEEITDETYGPLKVASERVVVDGQCLGVRGGRPQCGTVSDDSFLHAVDRACMVGTSGRD